MRRSAVGVAAFFAMAGCAAEGWRPDASGAWGLGFMLSALVFAVCWWSLVAEGRRDQRPGPDLSGAYDGEAL